MNRLTGYILALLLCTVAGSAAAQEVLAPSKIQARATRRQPSLGLPKRLDGQIDPAIWFETGVWKGADSLKARPFWSMGQTAKVIESWASEKPKNQVYAVWGPYQGGSFVAVCKKTGSGLGWKSIGFVIPPEGMLAGSSIWAYSHSVNWLESRIGYNLFPKLPFHLQEIIEEMTAQEHLCPFQEFDPGLDEGPDHEVDYDLEADYREMF